MTYVYKVTFSALISLKTTEDIVSNVQPIFFRSRWSPGWMSVVDMSTAMLRTPIPQTHWEWQGLSITCTDYQQPPPPPPPRWPPETAAYTDPAPSPCPPHLCCNNKCKCCESLGCWCISSCKHSPPDPLLHMCLSSLHCCPSEGNL